MENITAKMPGLLARKHRFKFKTNGKSRLNDDGFPFYTYIMLKNAVIDNYKADKLKSTLFGEIKK